jgi:hypothetical protein
VLKPSGRPRSFNKWEISGDTAYASLRHGVVVISKASLDLVQAYRWFTKLAKPSNAAYVYTHLYGNKKTTIHRMIMGITDSKILVDHKNRNTLDNTIENLRIASKAQNNINTKKRKNCRSIYKGVTIRPSGRYGCYISFDKKMICLGTFDLEEDAALAYNIKAEELYGEYANLNKIKRRTK